MASLDVVPRSGEPVGGALGCGSYEVYVLPRGGGRLFAAPDWSSVAWSRVLDDTSEASIRVDAGCIGALAGTRPWRHELAVYRDGREVWVGPIVSPSAPVDPDHAAYEVKARGISAWWDHRLIHTDHQYTAATDLAAIFQSISDDAMGVDTSPGLALATSPCGITGLLSVLASQHVMAGTQLRDLSKTGIDWTEVGRTVLAGGQAVPTASLGVFRDEHFIAPPTPILDGLQQANGWVVRGNGGGAAGDTVYGVAADAAAALLDGVLESVDTVTTIEDNTSAQAAAQSRLALTSAIISIQEAYLAPDAPFTIDQLVPGALCDLDLVAADIPIQGQYRLQRVTGDGTFGDEKIGLTFQPVGSG